MLMILDSQRCVKTCQKHEQSLLFFCVKVGRISFIVIDQLHQISLLQGYVSRTVLIKYVFHSLSC